MLDVDIRKSFDTLDHRHLREMLDKRMRDGVLRRLIGKLMFASDRMFHLWHEFEREHIDRKELIRKMKPIQAEIKKQLKILRDHPETTKKARGTVKDLLRQWANLWTFLEHERAVPTNNEAERSIRKAALWRKVSFGVESENGARFVERILTLVGTARRRSIDLLDWLTRAIQASLEGQPAPPFRP